MKSIDLLESMQLVDDKYIEEAANPVHTKTLNIYYYISLAASFLLTIVSGGWMLLSSGSESVHKKKTQMEAATAINHDGEFASVLFVLSCLVLVSIIAIMIVKEVRQRKASN